MPGFSSESKLIKTEEYKQDKLAPNLATLVNYNSTKKYNSKTFSFNLLFLSADNSEEHISSLCTIICEDKKDNIYIIWFIMWCLTFKFLNGYERLHRVHQLLGIIYNFHLTHKKFNTWIAVFEDIIKTLLSYGSYEMMNKVITMMKILKVKPNSTICQIYFESFNKANKANDNSKSLLIKLSNIFGNS